MSAFSLFRRKTLGAKELLSLAMDQIAQAKQAGIENRWEDGLKNFQQAVDYALQITTTLEAKQDSHLLSRAKSLIVSLVIDNRDCFYNTPNNSELSLALLDPMKITRMINLDIFHYQRWFNKQFPSNDTAIRNKP